MFPAAGKPLVKRNMVSMLLRPVFWSSRSAQRHVDCRGASIAGGPFTYADIVPSITNQVILAYMAF